MVNIGFTNSTSIFEEKKENPTDEAEKVDLTPYINALITKGVFSEVVGSKILRRDSSLLYSTFVSVQPKPYFSTYCEVLKTINAETNLPMCIWLEDMICFSRFNWSSDAVKHATTVTKNWFEKACKGCKIIISSEMMGGKLPVDFVEKYMSKLTFADFLTMLPFHKRTPSLITISDISHCIWSTYVFSRFHGLHFTTTANKRNHTIFRRLCGKDYSIALLHPIT
jgi:hypothetical protein